MRQSAIHAAKFPWNYIRSLLFHGGDTGSTPVRDANTFNHLRHIAARPETSIKLTHCRADPRKQHLYNFALRVALLIRQSLNVRYAAAACWAVEQSLALLWITLLTRAFLLVQIGRSAGAADLESTLQKLLHCRSGSRFASYIPIAVRRMGVSAAPM